MLRDSQLPTSPSIKKTEVILYAQIEALYYGKFLALRNINLPIYTNTITALVGPSGCGKSSLLRCFNRLNELIGNTRLQGKVLFHNIDVYNHPQ